MRLPDIQRATQRSGQHQHRRIRRSGEFVVDLDASHVRNSSASPPGAPEICRCTDECREEVPCHGSHRRRLGSSARAGAYSTWREGLVYGVRPQQPRTPRAGLDQRGRQLSRSLQHTLMGIVRAVVDNAPGAQFAGMSVLEGRRKVTTQAWSDEIVLLRDRAQYETGEGPCLESVYQEQTVRLPDMRAEQRWPKFTRRAVEYGIGSMLSLQLYVSGDNLGALNLYSRAPNAFNDESEHVGLLLAAHAAVAMASAQREEHLFRAMGTRDLIGQAKGILMERHKVTANQAFSLLIRASQNTNSKLRDVANHLTVTGEIAARSG
ncbi:MAG TPA: GAF and ANTAR domain-containing protein [Pseudonocardiaceae bacterium]